jgi:hypothetical protein
MFDLQHLVLCQNKAPRTSLRRHLLYLHRNTLCDRQTQERWPGNQFLDKGADMGPLASPLALLFLTVVLLLMGFNVRPEYERGVIFR